MTAIAELVSATQLKLLLGRLDELREVDAIMRESGGMPPAPEPMPLHRTGRKEAGR